MGKLTRKPNANSSSAAEGKQNKDLDRLADTFINNGGKSLAQKSAIVGTRGKPSDQSDPDAKIGITVKLLVKERDEINRLRGLRDIRDKVSLHDWIIEAVQDKLRKDLYKYK